jgi:hypothetical protein
MVFLGCGLASLSTALSLSSDATIRIETTEGTVALVKDTRTFFDEWLDVVDKLILIELLLWRAVRSFDVLIIRVSTSLN